MARRRLLNEGGTARGVKLLVATAVALGGALVAAPADAVEACTCTDKDPSAAVALEISASTPTEYSRIGPDQATEVVDLRGTGTEAVGTLPDILVGVDLATVPVLMAVAEAEGSDPCAASPPPDGAFLSLTGHAYLDDGTPVVWTGPCQGELTVLATPTASTTDLQPATTERDQWQPGLSIAVAVLVGSAVVFLAIGLITGRRQDPA